MTRELWELERDIELERAMLDLKLTQLSETLSLRTLAGDARDHAVGAGIDAAAKFLNGDSTHNAALASLLTAAVAWATRPKRQGHTGASQSEAPAAQPDPQPDPMSELRTMVQEMRARIEDGTEELSAEARDRVVAARAQAIAAAEEAAGLTAASAANASPLAFVRDNPIAVGAACLALGAVIGGALLMRDKDKHAARDRQRRFEQADQIFEQELERLRQEIRERSTEA